MIPLHPLNPLFLLLHSNFSLLAQTDKKKVEGCEKQITQINPGVENNTSQSKWTEKTDHTLQKRFLHHAGE